VLDCILGEEVRQQLDMVLVRMAQDDVADCCESRWFVMEECCETVGGPERIVVVQAAIVNEREVRSSYNKGKPGSDITCCGVPALG